MNDTTNFDVFRKGTTALLTTFVRDPANDKLVDVAANSLFELIDINNDTVLLSETFSASGGTLIKRLSTGVYQLAINTTTYPGEYLEALQCVLSDTTLNTNIFFKSVSARHFKYASVLRSQVDKACKPLSDYIENIDREEKTPVNLMFGYRDANLIFYLERGLQLINAVPPYTGLTIDLFPFNSNGAILIDAATIAALEAQGILAIDTDYEYSLGGNSMVIEHYSKLSSMVSSLLERYRAEVLPFKNQFLTKGMLLHQFLPGGVRDMRYLSALPSGFWSRMLSGAWG